jgi:hypothetical protein
MPASGHIWVVCGLLFLAMEQIVAKNFAKNGCEKYPARQWIPFRASRRIAATWLD